MFLTNLADLEFDQIFFSQHKVYVGQINIDRKRIHISLHKRVVISIFYARPSSTYTAKYHDQSGNLSAYQGSSFQKSGWTDERTK